MHFIVPWRAWFMMGTCKCAHACIRPMIIMHFNTIISTTNTNKLEVWLHGELIVTVLTSLSFSFHGNLYLYVIWPIFITGKLISWTLLLEIDNYEGDKKSGVRLQMRKPVDWNNCSIYSKEILKINVLMTSVSMENKFAEQGQERQQTKSR